MQQIINSYVIAFHKYAQSTLETEYLSKVSRYALLLNAKANQLLLEATENHVPDLLQLEKDLFEIGKNYVHKHFILQKQRKKSVSKK